MKKISALILTVTLLIVVGCSNNPGTINFYYWRSAGTIGKVEQDYFKQLKAQKLYIRLFDVDVYNNSDDNSKSIITKAKIAPFDSKSLNAEYVPVVFITNEIFKAETRAQYYFPTAQDDYAKLAERVSTLIQDILTSNGIASYNEIQIDCDWTESTQSEYFNFLTQLKLFSKKQVSCTIRLHQVKYKDKTGVPPVDKGYLMCYATSDPSNVVGNNSILNIPLLKDYLTNINEYPLPFDVALPIFSWGVVSNHLGKIKLINGLTTDELDSAYFSPTDNKQVYVVKDDLFFHNLYLNKDFKVRVENISPELLKDTQEFLRTKLSNKYNIVYYHLDAQFLKQYTIEQLQFENK